MQVQGIPSGEVMMDDKTLAALRHAISHMDEAELLAYGRKYRSMPESDEMKEASAEWKRRKVQKVFPANLPSAPDDFSKMAAEAPPGEYPWKRYKS